MSHVPTRVSGRDLVCTPTIRFRLWLGLDDMLARCGGVKMGLFLDKKVFVGDKKRDHFLGLVNNFKICP